MLHSVSYGMHVLTLTEEEMNTIVLAVGNMPIATVKCSAKRLGLKILECSTSNFGISELDQFHQKLKSAIVE